MNCFRLISIPGAPGLNPAHELVQLAQKIDWDRFEAALAGGFSPDLGAPAKATRLRVGLQYLQYTFNESNESVVARWVESPYGQYFCGYTHLQHQCPLPPTSMSRWRKRVGADRLVELLQETIALAKREGHVSQRDLERVNVDTTVQEKNITYPTDSKLLPDNPYDGSRRAGTGRDLDRRAGRDRCGRDRCVRRQGLSWARLYPHGERASARTTKRRRVPPKNRIRRKQRGNDRTFNRRRPAADRPAGILALRPS